MNSKEIQNNVQSVCDNFSKEEFVYDLLMAYGISKTSITRLKKGDFNLSKIDGEILYKQKIFFKIEDKDKLLSSIETISKQERVLKHKPRFIIISDYKTLVAKDMRLGRNLDISITDLPKYFDFFLPLAGSEVYNSSNDNEADRNASYKMATLYDLLIEENPGTYNSKESVHNLNIFLSRLLFCFFAEDTEIFEEESIFTNTLVQHTADNGSDINLFLNELFERLNVSDGSKYPDYLMKFPYVNGGLFQDKIESPKFTFKARKTLIELGELDWKNINPDIFGSMIQAVVIPEYRSDLGMHYTSVPNILKLIKPLFLDELYEEFENASTVLQLRKLINRISKIKFFDPACGSGNFLIITYKEIRVLEIKILQKIIDLSPSPEIQWSAIQLSQFYGIELDDFAHEMAILSLWLAEHQMNRIFEEQLFGFGKSKPILPLKEAGQIHQGNATRLDWKKVCPINTKDEVYIIGNPPYLGARVQDEDQKKDMEFVFNGIVGYNNMDYIACWFYKAKSYIDRFNSKFAFVTTNSICQGEQVELIWPHLIFNNIEIDFAYQSFKWTNNAKGNAGVSVAIVGLRNISNKPKFLYAELFKKEVKNINPYLIEFKNLIINSAKTSISDLPELIYGSMPNDGGFLLLSKEEKNQILDLDPVAIKYIKPFLGAAEFMNGVDKFCLWIQPNLFEESKNNKLINDRITSVFNFRKNSKRKATQKLASVPYSFGEVRYQAKDVLLIPQTGSDRREYLPIGFFDKNTIISNAARTLYNAKPWHFGLLSSRMHIVWVKAVSGRLKMDVQYSVKLSYNTFPFPVITIKQQENINMYVFAVLDERAKYPSKTMSQLYDPDKMPQGLKKAHEELDATIEKCYRLQPFTSDTERLEYMFKLYEEMVKKDTLFANQKKTRNSKSKN